MSDQRNPFLGVRLGPSEIEALDRYAQAHSCSRSEAARLALRLGLPLVSKGSSIDLYRMALLLEYVQASLDVIINREHADAADQLIALAQQRMDEFHA